MTLRERSIGAAMAFSFHHNERPCRTILHRGDTTRFFNDFVQQQVPKRFASSSLKLFGSSHHDDPSLADHQRDNKSSSPDTQRRDFLFTHSLGLLSGMATAPTKAEAADNALFRKNPLTNPLLEQVRIWDQAQADEYKYGGELEQGNAEQQGMTNNNNNKGTYYARLLVPILGMATELQQVHQLVQQTTTMDTTQQQRESLLRQVQQVLSQSKYDATEFKKVFNAFGDNIYYTDPDRANLYLGGGATPKSSQSMAYLIRNDILTNVQDMRAEVAYLLSSSSSSSTATTTSSTDDLVQMAATANRAMTQYLNQVVPPSELELARTLMASTEQPQQYR